MIHLRVFRPKGRTSFVVQWSDAATADEQERLWKRDGYCVIRSEDPPPKPARRKVSREAWRKRQKAKADAFKAKREPFLAKLRAEGKMGIEEAGREALALAKSLFGKKATARAFVGASKKWEPQAEVQVGRVVDLVRIFPMNMIEASAESKTFEVALVLLRQKLRAAAAKAKSRVS